MTVPRCFFHVIDGRAVRDKDGTGLPDVHVAQAEAIRLSGEPLRDVGGRFRNGTGWRIEVENERAQLLSALHVSAEDRLSQSGSAADPKGGSGAGPQPGPAKPQRLGSLGPLLSSRGRSFGLEPPKAWSSRVSGMTCRLSLSVIIPWACRVWSTRLVWIWDRPMLPAISAWVRGGS